MVDNDQTTDEATPAAPAAPRRGPGHRGADMRDTVAEMAERAQLISQEAGSKVSSAMKDVISAAAGLAGFAIESARDLVQYMVRRGQMTQEEADKLMREVEASHAKRKPVTPPAAPAPKAAAPVAATNHAPAPVRHVPTTHAPVKHAAPKAHEPAKKPAAKKPTMKPAAKKHAVKAAAKSKPKASGKTAKRR